jgi:hypothetical protein
MFSHVRLRRWSRATVTVTTGALVAMLAGCGTIDESAPYFPSGGPATATPSVVVPALTGNAPHAPVMGVTGNVARPNPQLTPGEVALTDVSAVCKLPKGVQHTVSSQAERAAAFQRYGLRYPHDIGRYKLDYLIPISLGGAASPANLWPMSIRGIGFTEKEQLNSHLRTSVCRGQLQLADVQKKIVTDWYTLWLKYGN